MVQHCPTVWSSLVWTDVLKLVTLQVILVHAASGFDLTVLHTNDFHDRIQETNKYSGSCSEKNAQEGKCFGGVARLKFKVDELRHQYPDSVLLDAGDQFQGTLWFYHFGGALTARFMNMIGYDAMALGNHEFDNGLAGLVPLVKNVTFPVLSSNLDLSKASDAPILQSKVKKSTVLTVGGQKIGVVGYTTTQTPAISNPGNAKFKDELTSIQAEIDTLVGSGVNKIIALGHAGYLTDLDLARGLRGVDVIVGGHSNTFLYNGKAPSNDDPVGGYPTVVTSPLTGDTVLVVQGYAYGKYLGQIKVTFDDAGKVTKWSGNPVLLDKSVSKDPDVLSVVNEKLPEVLNLTSEHIGYSRVHLTGDRRVCRVSECNMGNLITDGMIKQNSRKPDSAHLGDINIAIQNSGGIRASIEKGDITIGHAIKVQPFSNSVDIVQLRGATILKVLEHGASLWNNGTDPYGGFLQVSGLRIVYDMDQPAGSRVVDVQIRSTKTGIPRFEPLNMKEVYPILMSGFLAQGGDQYNMIPEEAVNERIIGSVDRELLVEHIKATTPVDIGLEGRIRFIQEVRQDPIVRKLTEEVRSSCVSDSASGLIPCSASVLLTLVVITFGAVKQL